MRQRLGILTLSLLIAALAVAGFAASAAADSGRPFTTALTGAAEVPSGDPDGSGVATITLNQGQGEICFSISVSGIALPATWAHIHVGAAGVAGPVIVPLTAPGASGTSSGCTTASQELIKAIRQNPENYYVNVHSTEYPGGAVRGQLSK